MTEPGADTLAQWFKPSLVTPADHIGALARILAVLLPIQLPC